VDSQRPVDLGLDPRLLAGAQRVLASHGLSGLTLERLAAASGVSRMTLHRRHVTQATVVAALVGYAGREYLAEVMPALTSADDAATRLRAVLTATCVVADRHLHLLAGLFSQAESPFHAPADATAPGREVATEQLFTAPLARLLRDGAADGTLAGVPDPDETATALFNVAGWGYVHLRHAQRWPAQRARAAILDLVMPGLLPRGNVAVEG
jgi:AcrR family transcriptional regulator